MYPSITSVRDVAALQSFKSPKVCQSESSFEENRIIDHYMYPITHPRNTFFRYVLAEPDPFAEPVWNVTKRRVEYPPTGCLYRPVAPERVLLALHDSAQQLKIEMDRLTATGLKGYSTTRATHSVNYGRWYFEVKILDIPESAAARIGWGQHFCDLQAPVGFNKFGYSWRSLKGTRFHDGYGKTYGQGYQAGDVLGFFIELPQLRNEQLELKSYKSQYLINNEGHFYYETMQPPKQDADSLIRLPGSTIEFFKNGYSEGVAFTEIFKGSYYPSISLFKNAKVRVNFGPKFKYNNILEDYEARAYSERAQEYAVELYLCNLLDLVVLSEQIPTLRITHIF